MKYDEKYLKEVILLAKEARDEGNMPFAAILADEDGRPLLKIKNREGNTHDRTDHAERVLAGEASVRYPKEVLVGSTLYSSAEPCAMCAGAIYWSGIGRVVYPVSEKRLCELTGSDERNPTMDVPCRVVFKGCQREIEVVGPVEEFEEAAVEVHSGFWEQEGQ